MTKTLLVPTMFGKINKKSTVGTNLRKTLRLLSSGIKSLPVRI